MQEIMERLEDEALDMASQLHQPPANKTPVRRGRGWARGQTPHGIVQCYVNLKVRSPSETFAAVKRHGRVSWKLDGKVISAAALGALA